MVAKLYMCSVSNLYSRSNGIAIIDRFKDHPHELTTWNTSTETRDS